MNITTLRTSAESIVGAALGASFKELPYQFDIEANDSRLLAAGYSVVWADGRQVFEIDQKVNLEQDLEVRVTKRVFVRNDDDKIVAEVDAAYSAIETIIKRFIEDKLDNPGICQEVQLTSMGAPIRIGDGRDIMAIPLTFRVRYLLS